MFQRVISCIFVWMLVGLWNVMGQSFIPDMPDDHKLIIVHHDTAYIVHTTDKSISNPSTEKIYSYVHHRELGHARGGYLGKLLDGPYVVYTNQTELLEKGQFKNGLKYGSWKTWHSNGEIASTETWRRGMGKGRRIEYTSKGKVFKEYKWHDEDWQLLKKYIRQEKARIRKAEKQKALDEERRIKEAAKMEKQAARQKEKDALKKPVDDKSSETRKHKFHLFFWKKDKTHAENDPTSKVESSKSKSEKRQSKSLTEKKDANNKKSHKSRSNEQSDKPAKKKPANAEQSTVPKWKFWKKLSSKD